MESIDYRLFKNRVYQITHRWKSDDPKIQGEIEWERDCMEWMANEIYREFIIVPRENQKGG